jgi:hypothetical protein
MARGAAAEADPDGYDSEGGSPGADRAASEPLPVRAAAAGHSMQNLHVCCRHTVVMMHGVPAVWEPAREQAEHQLWMGCAACCNFSGVGHGQACIQTLKPAMQDGGVLSVLELSDGEEEKKAAKRSWGRPSRAR